MLIHNAAWRLLGFVACTLPRAASAIYNTDNVKRGGKDRQKAEAEVKAKEIFLKVRKKPTIWKREDHSIHDLSFSLNFLLRL